MLDYVDDEKSLKKLIEIKKHNKQNLVKFIEKHNHITIDSNSIIDTQIKRLHAYKRQLMNIFRIIYLSKKLKSDPDFTMQPHTYIFGAKAAPSYLLAKKIIELINCVAKKINSDKKLSKYIKVIFIENYDVSKAMKIIPASDVSEQISLAGKEASGTSNMKFMMNGALTLGTLDGANVEIADLVGQENCVIFGMTEPEVNQLRYSNSYSAMEIYNSDSEIKEVMDSLIDGSFDPDINRFRMIFDDIYYKDEFFVLADLKSYIQASYKIDELYKDKLSWAKKCLINIAKSGYFSSDRTIDEYNKDIWHLQKLDLSK